MNYALVGNGRMGQAVDAQAALRGHARVAIVGPTDGAAGLGRERLGGARVAFEFTRAEAAEANIRALLDAGVSVVSGTTGWQVPGDLAQAAQEAGVACVIAPNFSLGVNLFLRVVEQAARAFGALGLHDPFIEEAHHRGKLDAPSGTARRLAEIVLASDPRLEQVLDGQPRGRVPPHTLQVVSTRAGAEPGTHRVGFDGAHDLVTLEHRARGREGFALGAVLAGEWLEGRRGVYGFGDVMEAIVRGELRVGGGAR